MTTRTPHLRLCLTLATLLFLMGTVSHAAPENAAPMLTDQAIVRAKTSPVLSTAERKFLADRDSEQMTVWIFFTDKGITSKEQFTRQASAVNFSEKVMTRRAKTGTDEILFADLPVVRSYVEEITAFGAMHRRTSRWLNAASYEIAAERIDAVAALPFVAEIRPVALYSRPNLDISPAKSDGTSPASSDATALDYGFAQAQLDQINVPVVHEKGFDGSGVTLAIFDTGYRKSHEVFAQHYLDGRVLAEYDFVFNDSNTANEGVDWGTQWNHGTLIWSVSGGYKPGKIIGPGYNANFILCKTEDVRSETQVEEDNWVAALEWVDSLGADVVTSSLAYADWYTYSDFDGATAITTLAANTAAGLGIVVCNAIANSGPSSGTLHAPADAFDILACGAVELDGDIAAFSSRGPTYDGRTKPEVVANGVGTDAAVASSDVGYGTANGTSLSTPLVAGAAVLMVQARPNFPPTLIRQALMETADNAATPNNDLGWGVINVDAALSWGVDFDADVTVADAPQTVQFTDQSTLGPNAWQWAFGDGDSSTTQHPSHTYSEAGGYNVSLTIETTEYGSLSAQKDHFVVLLGDTLTYGPDSVYAGEAGVLSVNLANSQPLNRIKIPLTFEAPGWLTFDSVSLGDRTSYFEHMQTASSDATNRRYVYELIADFGGGSPPLPAGKGEVLKVHFSTDQYAFGGQSAAVDSIIAGSHEATLTAPYLTYEPDVFSGFFALKDVLRGDFFDDGERNISDLTQLVDYLFRGGPEPVTVQAGDVNRTFFIDVSDVNYLVDFLFRGGSAPPTP